MKLSFHSCMSENVCLNSMFCSDSSDVYNQWKIMLSLKNQASVLITVLCKYSNSDFAFHLQPYFQHLAILCLYKENCLMHMYKFSNKNVFIFLSLFTLNTTLISGVSIYTTESFS